MILFQGYSESEFRILQTDAHSVSQDGSVSKEKVFKCSYVLNPGNAETKHLF